MRLLAALLLLGAIGGALVGGALSDAVNAVVADMARHLLLGP